MKMPPRQIKCKGCEELISWRRTYCDPCYKEMLSVSGKRLVRERRKINPKVDDPLVHEYILQNYKPFRIGSLAEVSRRVGLYPITVQRIADRLGIDRPSTINNPIRPWTKEEEEFLMEHAFNQSWVWIGKKLQRTARACYSKANQIGCSSEYRNYYNAADVAKVLGVVDVTVAGWFRNGLLRGQQIKLGPGRVSYRTTEKNIIRFIMENPLAFRLRDVDQIWFMDMLTNGGVLKKALIAAGKEEEKEYTYEPIPKGGGRYAEKGVPVN
jgi:hypothetical protein